MPENGAEAAAGVAALGPCTTATAAGVVALRS